MDRLMNGWMGGWVACVSGCMDGLIDRQTHRFIESSLICTVFLVLIAICLHPEYIP